MNIARFDRLSCGFAATLLIAGFGGAAQAQTPTAASLLQPGADGAIVAQSQPTPLDSPNQLPPPGEPVPQQPSQPGRPAAPPRPTPDATETQPTPLEAPNQLPPPGEPVPQQPSEPGRTAAPLQTTPGTTPETQPTPLDSPNQLPPPGSPVPGQPTSPSPQVQPPTTPTPPPTTRPAPPPRSQGEISPGRATRSGSSYIGIGGNIGIGDGGTSLGDTSFAVISKIGLTPLFSVRPSVLFSDDVTILIPVTIDFIPGITRATESLSSRVGLRASPFVGAGVAVSTGDNGDVDFLATGGVDVPIADRFTATAQVNVTLFDDPAVGLLLGVGYNF